MFTRLLSWSLGGLLLGFVFGPGLLTGATLLYYQITNPRFFNDGQWGMIFFWTIGAGAIYGAGIGYVGGVLLALRRPPSK